MKPTIGVIPLVDYGRQSLWMLPGYLDGLLQAGAAPVMLPLTQDSAVINQLVAEMDGFLLTGGQDIHPDRYRAQALPACGETSHARDAMELRLIRAALREDRPLLGICRGIQMLNVYFGGTLFQDLPQQHPHGANHCMKAPYDRAVHTVNLVPDSPLQNLLDKDQLGVNSYHHQAIRRLAARLEVMAISEDDLIEAVCLPDRRFVWGVQWHPELLYHSDPDSLAIFQAFVRACKAARRKRTRMDTHYPASTLLA